MEECDVGPDGDYLCSKQCTVISPEAGCCSADGGSNSLLLAGLVGGLVIRRRRKSTRRV
jgi:MYXO-CTERM domain-containing protein